MIYTSNHALLRTAKGEKCRNHRRKNNSCCAKAMVVTVTMLYIKMHVSKVFNTQAIQTR